MFQHHFVHRHHDCDRSQQREWGRHGARSERERPFGRFGGHHGNHPFGRGFGRGGRERMFDAGELQLVLLNQIASKPSYGYELIKALEERLAGAYAPSPGVVYPTLTLLEERGFITASSESGKKVFTITDAGQQELQTQAERLAEIEARLEDSGARFGRERSPELMRAFLNLRGAIRARMVRGRITPEQMKRIAEAVNAAAESIDKL